jgi:hypothetical protein
LSYDDFLNADEIFSTGNFQKVAPMTRIDTRLLEPGPFYARARALYWDFAHSRGQLREASWNGFGLVRTGRLRPFVGVHPGAKLHRIGGRRDARRVLLRQKFNDRH